MPTPLVEASLPVLSLSHPVPECENESEHTKQRISSQISSDSSKQRSAPELPAAVAAEPSSFPT